MNFETASKHCAGSHWLRMGCNTNDIASMKSTSPPTSSASAASSYRQILKSSTIVGGAQAINMVVGMVRTKVVALLLGPSGVGLVGLYESATNLTRTISGLGLDSSSVRDVAEAHSSEDAARMAHTTKMLRRACWVTGLLGWALTAAFSYPLSRYLFGTGDRAWALALLGASVFLSALSSGQSALLQGTRRIADLARLNILGAVFATIVAASLYAWLGENGIVPVLITTAAANLAFSWWFARQIPVLPVSQSWAETLEKARRMVSVGMAIMYGAVLASIVAFAIRSLIVSQLGVRANGIYQAAWAVSGLFAGFILNAMGADFYPRLSAVAQDNQQVNKLVNHQIEIGVLLALPGLVGTLLFAPWFMILFYSREFATGAALLPWFVVGVFCQVLTWPCGMIQMAKGASKWIYFGRTFGNLLHLGLTFLLIKQHGVQGVAWAFALFAFLHGVVAVAIAGHLSDFRWTPAAVRLILLATAVIGAALALRLHVEGLWGNVIGCFLTLAVCISCCRGILLRLGTAHRLTKAILSFPGASLLFRGINTPEL